MSLWDSVKPAKKKAPHVTNVELAADQKYLALTFSDGVSHQIAARTLRQYCPCAGCVEEWTGKRTFEVDTIPADMKVVEVVPVGNYALTFTFGDLHRTGIFTWELLRELCETGATAR